MLRFHKVNIFSFTLARILNSLVIQNFKNLIDYFFSKFVNKIPVSSCKVFRIYKDLSTEYISN